MSFIGFSEQHIPVEPIPEPSTVFGFGLTIGLATLLKNNYFRKRNKKDVS